MKVKKEIGKLFKDALEGGEKSPSGALWSQLESELKKERKRRAIWFWSGLGVLLLLLTAGVVLWVLPVSPESVTDSPSNETLIIEEEVSNKKIREQENVVNSEKTETRTIENDTLNSQNTTLSDSLTSNSSLATDDEESVASVNETLQTESSLDKTGSLSKSENTRQSKEKIKQTVIKSSDPSLVLPETSISESNAAQEDNGKSEETVKNEVPITENNSSVTTDNTTEISKTSTTSGPNKKAVLDNSEIVKDSIIKDSLGLKNKVSLPDSDLKKEKDSIPDEETSEKKLAFSVHAAPVYYDLLQKGSVLDPSLSGNDTQGQWNLGYGFFFYYRATEKLSLRFGANKITAGYLTKNIPEFDSNDDPTDLLDYKIDAPGVISRAQLANLFGETGFVDLDHELNYIEIPLEVNYLVKAGKLQFTGIGGFSTWLLNTNEVFATSPSGRVFIGNATELSDISFSLNAGVGIYYNFSGNWLFTLEPVFKYQLNAFKDNPDEIHPFTFGIYSGFRLRF
ncbi:hypothetical protein ACJD0Z_01495 [Flavobacteriaceae bacterium M23B6Z8]